MKKLSLILFMSIAGFFVSCEKESNDTISIEVEQEALIGTWQVTGYQLEDGKSITEVDGQSIAQNYTSYGKDYDMTLTFNEDPQTAVSNGSYTIVITTTLLGENFTQEVPAYSAFAASEWKMDGSKLVLINDGEETVVQITESSDTKLVMVMDFNEEVVINTSTKTSSTGKLTITLEK